MNNVIKLADLQMDKEFQNDIDKQEHKKAEVYKGEYNLFIKWCKDNNKQIEFDSVSRYLHEAIKVQGVRLNTFNRKSAGLSFYLNYAHGIRFTDEQKEVIKKLRQMYKQPEYIELKGHKPTTSAQNKNEVMELINKYDTDKKTDIRIRAISLVNLITANRPSEMVLLKVKYFDLVNNKVFVPLVKQGEPFEKRLTLECVNAIKKYIKAFNLEDDDYFVGKCNKYGNYTSAELDSNVYSKHIKRWIGIVPYSLRKTQITSMYNNGADVTKIALQSGHKNQETITKHYLNIDKSHLDEYL
ncbi:MAG: site-specific integrase [Erysipelotrichaceae bacterium]